MIQTGFESRIKVQDVIENQLPEYVLDESPKTVDFLKQYYISQEFQGGVVDIVENLDQYLKVDNLTPEVIVDNTTTTGITTVGDTVVNVSSTKGFPNQYGLLKIDDEIITYTGLTTNTFTGCVRGFSGITSYHNDLNQEELVFTQTEAASHSENSKVQNLSSLFLKEFYKKVKYTFTPGFEDRAFYSDLNVGNFIKNARSFYQSKGTDESFRILFNVLYGETPKVINLEEYLLKSSDAEYIRREVVIADLIGSGNPLNIVGQSIFKTNDSSTTASISAVEPFTRGNKTYFKLSLFVGYSDRSSSIEGIFKITPNTKCLERVQSGSSVISVDSTIGFEKSGTILSGSNLITYTDKSINQFLNCSGIENTILPTDDITSSTETYYAYENGDTSKKVELRLTGVISDFIAKSEYILADEGQTLTVKHLGDSIKNPEGSKTYKEVFANSWIYNTSSSIEVESIDGGGDFTLKSPIDRSHLKKGDIIEIIDTATKEIKFPLYDNNGNIISDIPYIDEEISFGSKNISISNLAGFVSDSSSNYSIRRKINKSKSSIVPFKYGNESLISDVQNVYIEDDKFAYVASNSLPSSGIGFTDFRFDITNNLVESSFSSSDSLVDLNEETGLYSTILFDNVVPFITGDRVYYRSESLPLDGLEEGSYYVKVLSDPDPNLDKKKIKIFNSLSFINDDNNAVKFSFPDSGFGDHIFTLYSQRSRELNPPKILKKFSLNPNIEDGSDEKTIPGSVGMLINGVEILNYKSKDKVYYGPLKNASVLNGGENFDVINPPRIEVSTGLGVTALIQPVVTGEITDIIVDTQDFDIDKVLSVNVSGGNVRGGSFNTVLSKRRREVLLDGRTVSDGGGISTNSSQLIFLSDHNFVDGQEIVYRNNGNTNISIGAGTSSLVNNGVYYTKVDNNLTVKIFGSYNDYVSNTNPISFFNSSPGGNHKFLTNEVKNTISKVEILDGGVLTNKKLIVKTSGISTSDHTINFENHNFSNGDIVEYSPVSGIGTIVGLSTENQYYILSSNKNSFRLCDAGIGGTIRSNFDQQKIVKFSSTGDGLQQFKYPDIEVSITFSSVGLGTTTQIQTINATPVVKGSISDLYLYEPGTGYGSTIINFHNKPILTIKNGREAKIEPIIVNGLISQTNIQFGGFEYYSTPDLIVVDPTGSGTGAKLKASINEGKIIDVQIVQPGIGYSTTSRIDVISSGKDSVLDCDVRDLTVNLVEKISTPTYSTFNEVISGSGLQYFVSAYDQGLRNSFKDFIGNSSKIIGWAYDGNPIYGSYIDSVSFAESGYVKDTSNVVDRPSFPEGFFVEDYRYDGSGNLDKNNGRYAITEEFPNGVYAYYATIDPITEKPVFPYFIGESFRSNSIEDNKVLDQKFDFNNSSLIRNTFPYKIAEEFADNDFIIESNEIKNQKIIVESVSKGSITGFDIINPGNNYKVNDKLTFNSSNTGGGDLRAKVSSIKGKDIVNLETSFNQYTNSVFVWDNDKVSIYTSPYHELSDGDNVIISGFSTSSLTKLNDSFKASVTPISNVGLTTQISSGSDTTEIYVTSIPSQVSAGTSIQIGSEILEVLNIFPSKNIIRVKRGNSAISHNVGTAVTFKNNLLTVDAKLDYFESKFNKKVYFNPKESVAIGTHIGIGSDVSFNFGNETISRSIPTQSIYIENHPFATNQKVTFNSNGNTTIAISTSPSGSSISLPSTIYIVNKSQNTIGIKTSLTTDEVFFISNGQDKDNYYFETNFEQQLGLVESAKTTVSISTFHELLSGDLISLNVKPNLNVGIGTSTSIKVSKDINTGKILFNPVGFTSAGINTITNEITIPGHDFITGDKVIYDSTEIALGLQTGSYFVHRVNNTNIKLCESFINSISNPPITSNLIGIGGTLHTLSAINPQIKSIKNNNLVFDVSDSSLVDHQLKIYYDNDFINEFVSVGSTSILSLVRSGVSGNSGAKVTITYNENIPEKLYYSLEKDGEIIVPDKDSNNYSQISFVDSEYVGNYSISGVAGTTFNINLTNKPEKLSYENSECEILEYTTTSLFAKGPVDQIKLISGGVNYKKPPVISGSDSEDGENLFIIPKSKNIGNVNQVRIINQGFEYSSDKTLEPQAFISPNIKLKNLNEIDSISILSGGKNFVSEPNLVLINSDTRDIIDNGILKPVLSGSSISNVIIEINPKGISDASAELFTTNNSNGVSIVRVLSNASGIFTCSITTPVVGFTTFPFAENDEVFVEGIQKFGSSGDGFNSSDYGYRFLKVKNYTSGGIYGDEVTLEIPDLDSNTNTGIAKTIQDSTGVIINKKNYPTFLIDIKPSLFEIGEKLLVNGNKVDLQVDEYTDPASPKVFGTYDLSSEDVITGSISKNVATIRSIEKYNGSFNIDFSSKRDEGWNRDTGKLNQDYQVLPDNDYHQNLSYSVKSSKQWKDIRTPVNSLVHTVGLKNFSDTEIISKSSDIAGISSIPVPVDSIVKDIITESRVDTINGFDFVVDTDVIDNTSRFLKLQNKRLSDYLEIDSSIVLRIDDISEEFSNTEDGDVIDKKNFVLKNNGTPIFAKTFDPSDSNVLDTSTGVFSIENHFFSDNEELIYRPLGVGATPMVFVNGLVSDILPSSVFVTNKSDTTFQISTTRSGSPVSFSSFGGGNSHQFAMAKNIEKCIISIDNIVQYPISLTKNQSTLSGNGGSISTTSSIFSLSGISSITPGDILKIDDEYMDVINVGLGTQNIGPITNIGSEKLVQVDRAFIGSATTTHTDGTSVGIYRGSFNIVGDEIFFTKAPRGNSSIDRNENNLVFASSDFSGRVFLRKNYDTNQIYDDISDEFTGVGRTFTVTVGGANTIGIGTSGGNGVVFINGIFQTPTTENNTDNNFSIVEDNIAGITSIVFSGIRSDINDSNSIYISEGDVNQNETPRGGIIISLGSTGGIGYAPLVGASVTAVVGAGGSITSINTNFSGGTYGSGYNGIVSIGVSVYDPSQDIGGDTASITAIVGAGGSLSFNIGAGGTGYNSPEIFVSEPSYENLEVIGVSRLGVGSTTETGVGLLMNIEVGESFATGTASTYFAVNNFSISRSGYSFKKGDVFTPVGLVTDRRLASPISEFKLTVLETFSDNFAAWQFGELDFIDSVKNYQDGRRVRFPLFYNGDLISFEKKNENSEINLANSLLIIINGVIQDPGVSYNFNGGTSFVFTEAPRPEDDIAIFFYRGTRDEDDTLVTNIFPSIERGDIVQVLKNNAVPESITQDKRTVFDLTQSDKFETNPYSGDGITEISSGLLSWIKQKTDRVVNGEFVYKTRESILSQTYPTAKVIGDVLTSDNYIFVDNADIFDYEGPGTDFSAILLDGKEVRTGILSASIGLGGTVTSLTIVDSGIGYTGSTVNVEFSQPYSISQLLTIGAGTTVITGVTTSVLSGITSIASNSFIADISDRPGTITGSSSTIGINTSLVTLGQHVICDTDGVISLGTTVTGIGTNFISIGSSSLSVIDVTSTFDFGISTSIIDSGTEIVSIGIGTIFLNKSTLNTDVLTNVDVKFGFTGIGSTAVATISVGSGGTLTSPITISNPGSGYNKAPVAIVASPEIDFEGVTKIADVKGFSGIVTGISTTINSGQLALTFDLKRNTTFGLDLQSGYPLLIKNTTIGSGVTSVINSDSEVVGIGTTFLDNIYYVSQISNSGNTASIICNIHSNSSVSGILSTGDYLGEFSWGRFGTVTRSSSPISLNVFGKTVDVGLSTFPSIQRRGAGLRQTGPLLDELQN